MKFWTRLMEKFKQMDLNRIDEDTMLIHVHRDAYKYVERDHALIVQVELQTNSPQVIVYADTIQAWLPPHENERISPSDKQRIVHAVCQGLERRKISYVVQ